MKLPGAIDADYFWNKPKIDLSVLRVCKQIHREASHYFYGANTFCFLEGCDDFQEDENAVFDNRAYHWLQLIGKTNRLLVQRMQLRMREERDIDYYERLLAYISSQTPNLKRLGLVLETHHIGHIHTTANVHITDWQPNYVVPIEEDKMRRLAEGLKSLNLSHLVIAETRDHMDLLKKLPELFNCKIQAIEPKSAKRMDLDCLSFLELKVWHESPGDPYNQKIRQDMRASGLEAEYFGDIPDEQDGGKDDVKDAGNEYDERVLSDDEIEMATDDE